jgi:hypothetical protein
MNEYACVSVIIYMLLYFAKGKKKMNVKIAI